MKDEGPYKVTARLGDLMDYKSFDLLGANKEVAMQPARIVPSISRASHNGGLMLATTSMASTIFLSIFIAFYMDHTDGKIIATAISSVGPGAIMFYMQMRRSGATEEHKNSEFDNGRSIKRDHIYHFDILYFSFFLYINSIFGSLIALFIVNGAFSKFVVAELHFTPMAALLALFRGYRPQKLAFKACLIGAVCALALSRVTTALFNQGNPFIEIASGLNELKSSFGNLYVFDYISYFFGFLFSSILSFGWITILIWAFAKLGNMLFNNKFSY